MCPNKAKLIGAAKKLTKIYDFPNSIQYKVYCLDRKSSELNSLIKDDFDISRNIHSRYEFLLQKKDNKAGLT